MRKHLILVALFLAAALVEYLGHSLVGALDAAIGEGDRAGADLVHVKAFVDGIG